MSAGGRGVDTTDTAAAALPAAQALARQTNAIVAVTGEVDYVTDGQRTRTVAGGDPLMTRVVGTGCALSAVVAVVSTPRPPALIPARARISEALPRMAAGFRARI
ncbi:hydroxyethylthiazole kinase [Enterobacter cloacae]|uniref:hydroxyethylthiazole kinase n=1 Tax=Enterobacter cloacae TaxID=550 RepID=UPI00373FD62F